MDSKASNYMTNHKECFSYLEKSEQLGVVETEDDTPHPIEHIRDIPLSHVDQNGIMRTTYQCKASSQAQRGGTETTTRIPKKARS